MAPPDFLNLLDCPASNVAVESAEQSVSYSLLGSSVRAVAGALSGHGVCAGDRVAVMLPNSVAAVQIYLACAGIGAIWVGVNPGAPAAERDRQCSLVDPKLVVTASELSSAPPTGRVVLWSALHAEDSAPYDRAWPDIDEPCAIGFSSGTTGTPKALVHSRRGVSLTAAAYADARLRRDDRVGVILPMSIHNLIVAGALPALFAGATCVAVDQMNAAGVAAACGESHLTTLSALVPATIYDLVHDQAITPDMLSTLRMAGTGAAGLAETLRSAFETKFGVRLIGSYGMTEAPGVLCVEDPDEPHRAGSSGGPLSHVVVEASDARGHPLPAHREGELVVRAASAGAWPNQYRPAIGTWTEQGLVPRSTAQQDLRTGDYGWIDDGGAIHVTGRKADVLIRGGVNVNAAELESVLGQLPAIRGIAVIGEPDERLGQRIVAYVELATNAVADPAELRELARGVLAHGKVPDEFVIGVLPRNAMGKVARAQLCRR